MSRSRSLTESVRVGGASVSGMFFQHGIDFGDDAFKRAGNRLSHAGNFEFACDGFFGNTYRHIARNPALTGEYIALGFFNI